MSAEEREAQQQDADIAKQLRTERELVKREIKLLLLGAGESGKSTFVKQMRIIHGEGFNAKDCLEYKHLVFQNILRSTQALVGAMVDLRIAFENEDLKDSAKRIALLDAAQYKSFREDAAFLKAFWADIGVQRCFRRSREFQLTDSTKYYFDSIDRIAEADYVPTIQDVLRVRVPTSGIVENQFEISKSIFRIIDVGGQRSERRKWIHCFENVASIIFLVSLSEYDQQLFEEETQNRLKESLRLFDNIVNYRWFSKTSIILFLNKTDIFDEKIRYSNLRDYFPEYDGADQDGNHAREFILTKFADLNRMDGKALYPHFTCATDTENIRFVFMSVKDTILQQNLKDYGLM
ncbi:GTP-binding protein alpha subunit [Capsaspora owczarzaki ATCC 30864]|uniref:GTP-binding protein alpha subunit n=2 Tax=Capsaspora owczarzaki (strain ATCC 30864) TaxID=595528 RepID=A0A0D2WP82_CAPO3|nr:GTP-binding protein alpha subunit [Capsaspora owczarzaki ATCC 30864]